MERRGNEHMKMQGHVRKKKQLVSNDVLNWKEAMDQCSRNVATKCKTVTQNEVARETRSCNDKALTKCKGKLLFKKSKGCKPARRK